MLRRFIHLRIRLSRKCCCLTLFIFFRIQKFIQWSRRINKLRFRRLALTWDIYVLKLANIKIEDNKLLAILNNKEGAKESNTGTKTNSKIEGNVQRQRRIIDRETSVLGLDKKDEVKRASEIKTPFEVLLDHM